jgi:hypothetical protein
VSDGNLEDKCEDSREMHISGEIPILDDREDVPESDLDNSQIIHVSAPKSLEEIQTHRYWKWVRIDVVRELIEKLLGDKKIAEARGEVLEANVAREYKGKIKAETDLKKAQSAVTYWQSEVSVVLGEFFKLYDAYLKLEKGNYALQNHLKNSEEKEVGLILEIMRVNGEAEAKETMLKLYEQRFGSREKLLKLLQAEEKCEQAGRKCKKQYDCISQIIEMHETGKCPKTVGQRIAYCFERLTDLAFEMAKRVYNVLDGRKYKSVEIKECG